MSTDPQDWPAPTARSPIQAQVRVPGSKSLTNRFLVLAALADGPSLLRAPLRSRDTLLMAQALRSMGIDIVDVGADWRVVPRPLRGGTNVECGLAGTIMRFLPGVAALPLARSPSTATSGRGCARWDRCWTRCAPLASPSSTMPAEPCRSSSMDIRWLRAAASLLTPRHRASSCRDCCWPERATPTGSPCTTSASRCPASRTSR